MAEKVQAVVSVFVGWDGLIWGAWHDGRREQSPVHVYCVLRPTGCAYPNEMYTYVGPGRSFSAGFLGLCYCLHDPAAVVTVRLLYRLGVGYSGATRHMQTAYMW